MGLFGSNKENVSERLERIGLSSLEQLQSEEQSTITEIMNLLGHGKAQSVSLGENAKLTAQAFLLESITLSNLLTFKKLDELNKNIEKLISK